MRIVRLINSLRLSRSTHLFMQPSPQFFALLLILLILVTTLFGALNPLLGERELPPCVLGRRPIKYMTRRDMRLLLLTLCRSLFFRVGMVDLWGCEAAVL